MVKSSFNSPGSEDSLQALIQEVQQLQQQLTAMADAVQRVTGLSKSERRVIHLLAEGPRTVPDLAQEQAVSRQFIQTVVNALAGRGLVTFKVNPRHKRSRLLVATHQGLDAWERARQHENRVMETLLRDLLREIPRRVSPPRDADEDARRVATRQLDAARRMLVMVSEAMAEADSLLDGLEDLGALDESDGPAPARAIASKGAPRAHSAENNDDADTAGRTGRVDRRGRGGEEGR